MVNCLALLSLVIEADRVWTFLLGNPTLHFQAATTIDPPWVLLYVWLKVPGLYWFQSGPNHSPVPCMCQGHLAWASQYVDVRTAVEV